MKINTEKIIDVIDRILWNSRMASLTSPTFWGRCTTCDETSPWITSVRNAEASCTRCDQENQHRHNELVGA